jgi:hypothetical protein
MSFKKSLKLTAHLLREVSKPLKKTSSRVASASIAVVLIIGVVVINLVITQREPSSALSQPTTPTVPVCGLRNTADDGETPTLPNPAYTNEITPGGTGGISYYRYWAGGNGTDAQWYVMQTGSTSATFYEYDATNDSLTKSFTITPPSNEIGQGLVANFAVNPTTGDVYVASYNPSNGSGDISEWNTSGTMVWDQITSYLVEGAVYGYTNSSGVYTVGVVTGNSSNRGGILESELYSASGSAMGTNSIAGTDIQNADAHNGDLVVLNNNTSTVYIWNSTATTQTFYMSAGSNAGSEWSGTINGANELSNGTIVLTSYSSRQMIFFSPTGAYLGRIGADIGAGAPLDTVYSTGDVVVEEGRIYYIAENPFSTPNKLTYITTANAASYLAAPQGTPYYLGLGANVSTPATDNYFSSGTTPSMNITFESWWQNTATSFTGTYTIRNQDQVEANTAGTPQAFSIPSTSAAYSTGTASVPLTLPAATPGVYEVNVQLSQGGNVVGAACGIYSVGASNVTLNLNSLPSNTDTQGVALAYQFGQKLYRSAYNIDACYPGVTTPTSSTPLNCPSSMDSDISAAATLAAQDGITYEIQLGTGSTFDSNAVSSGQWGRLVGLMAAHYSEVNDWEVWNEPDNSYSGSPSSYVTSALEPAYNAIKAVSSSDKVIGISNENYSIGEYQQYVNAGALHYLDIVAIHSYTGWNRSYEEQGNVIPSIYDSTETGQVQALQTYLTGQGYTGSIFDTESGFWNNNASEPYDYYLQGDKLVTKMILEQSVGLNWLSNFFNDGSYTASGAYWGLIGGPNNVLNPGGLAAANYQANLGGRTFQQWLPTSIPHTYAALYGTSSSDTANDVLAVWADSYNVGAVPTITGGGSINVTSEYGASSTVTSGSPLTLSDEVQYLKVPVGKTISIGAAESYGTNYALTTGGASATASTSYSCGGSNVSNPDVVLQGIDDSEGSNYICGGRDGTTVWSATNSDSNPTLTITLGSPQTLDRVFVSSFGIGSSLTGLRDYNVQVNNGNGTFSPQTVSQIRITNMDINYSGYGDGLPPSFWASMGTGNNLTAIYDVEAYGPGTGAGTPPSVSITAPAANTAVHGSSETIAANITPAGSNTISSAKMLVGGAVVQTATGSPYNFSLNTLNYLDGTYNVEVQATDNQGNTVDQYQTVNITNGDLNADGKVSLADLITLAQNYNKTGTYTYAQGNINGATSSPEVSLNDLIVLAKNYGYTAP